MRYLSVLLLVSLLTGCGTTSAITSALSSAINPGVSASLQIGDDHNSVDTVGKKETTTVESKVSDIRADREVKVDSSSQKQDKKTEISEVRGDVKVIQGPSGGLVAFLASGWVALALVPLAFLLYLYRRRKTNASNAW